MKTALCTLLAFVGLAGAAMALPPVASPKAAMVMQVSPEVLAPAGAVVRSCAREVTVRLQPDSGTMRAAFGTSYAEVGGNEMKYTVSGSYVFGSNVICQYRGQTADVLNITYAFLCPAASPAGLGHRFAYHCSR